MQHFGEQFRWLCLAMAVAAWGQQPAVASADSLFAGTPTGPIERVWVAPVAPLDAVPGDSGEALPLFATGNYSGEFYASGAQAPGLQFALNPVEEEVLLGWRFAF